MSEKRGPPKVWAGKPGPDHYPGKALPGCPVEDPEAVLWGATIGGTIFNFGSPRAVTDGVQRMLDEAYALGRKHARDEIRERIGL